MRGVSVPLIERVPDYEVRDGLVHVMLDGEAFLAMPVPAFKMGIVRSARAIEIYEEGLTKRVVPIGARR
jgi:hypothetical protein